MKFPILKSEKPKLLSVKRLDGGLNKAEEKTLIADNCLTD